MTLGHEGSLTNVLCFPGLVMLWLRAYGIEGKVAWQWDFGEEFGESNPKKLRCLQKKCYGPLGAKLAG